jgi:hypothetical protein
MDGIDAAALTALGLAVGKSTWAVGCTFSACLDPLASSKGLSSRCLSGVGGSIENATGGVNLKGQSQLTIFNSHHHRSTYLLVTCRLSGCCDTAFLLDKSPFATLFMAKRLVSSVLLTPPGDIGVK